MKRICSTILVLFSFIIAGQSQELLKHKWHRFSLGGNNGYFIKTTQFSATTMTEDQFGSGGAFDNNPMTISIAKIYTTANDERVIADYGDSAYYVLVFRNFTPGKVSVCMNTEAFKTITDAEAFVPEETGFSDWFTEDGYKQEMKKPVMPEMTQKDAVAFVQFLANAITEIKKTTAANPSGEDETDGLAIALLISVVPAKFAESKGFHAYKSMPVIERGINKFKNDPEVKKILKQAGLPVAGK